MTGTANVVQVGLGDRREAMPEIDWAAAEAQARGASLRVVRVYHLAQGTQPWMTSTDVLLIEDLRRDAERRLRAAVGYLAERWPEVEVDGVAIDGFAWDVLIEGSAAAALTVLGSRQLGAIGAVALGSVSTVVAAAAHGPVVVASRPGAAPGEPGSVVVGVDGSEHGDEVLAFAFDYASRHRRPLHAVYCWRPDVLVTSQWRAAHPAPEQADRWLAEALAGWQEKYPDVQTHRGVVRDHPVGGLVAASAGQDLLVVGSRSRHARIAVLLGSVSQGVLHSAACPVAVVHPRNG
jgi:nucleotide-binding universal stress UspA family protein